MLFIIFQSFLDRSQALSLHVC